MSDCKVPKPYVPLLQEIMSNLQHVSSSNNIHVSCFRHAEDESSRQDPEGSYEDATHFDLYLTPYNQSTWRAVCDEREKCEIKEQLYHASSGWSCDFGISTTTKRPPRQFEVEKPSVIPHQTDVGVGGSGGTGGSGGAAGASGTGGAGGEVADSGSGGIPPDARVDSGVGGTGGTGGSGGAAGASGMGGTGGAVVDSGSGGIPVDAQMTADSIAPISDAGVGGTGGTGGSGGAAGAGGMGGTGGEVADSGSGGVPVADFGVPPADAALEADAGEVLPPLDLASLFFGIDPSGDQCFAIDPVATSACLAIQSEQAFDVARLLPRDAQGNAIQNPPPIDDIQFDRDDNSSIPRNIETIDRDDRHRYTRLVPININTEDAVWGIELHDEFPQHPEDNIVDPLGNMRVSLEHCVNGDCSQDSYTVYIDIINNGNLCMWRNPKPDGSPCLR